MVFASSGVAANLLAFVNCEAKFFLFKNTRHILCIMCSVFENLFQILVELKSIFVAVKAPTPFLLTKYENQLTLRKRLM